MKKKLTILLFVTAFALSSTAQVLVKDSVKIATAGILKAKAEVVVSNEGGVVLNNGTLNLEGGVTILSSYASDGIFHNASSNLIPPTNPNNVKVKRINLDKTKWHIVAFPFPIKISEVKAANPGTVGMWFQTYNNQRRAQTGKIDGNWDMVTTGDETVLSPLHTYAVGYSQSSALTELVFPANSYTTMFTPRSRTANNYYDLNAATQAGGGWADAGGFYTSYYLLNEASTGGNEAYAYQYTVGPTGIDRYEAIDLSVNTTKYAAPFSATFIKLLYDETEPSSIPDTYDINVSPIYSAIQYAGSSMVVPRSDKSQTYDYLSLQLKGERGNFFDNDNCLLFLGSSYKEETNGLDGPKLNSSSDEVSEIWLLNQNSRLFASRLPDTPEREVALGVNFGAEGTYSIGLSEEYTGAYKKVELIDKLSNTRTDLLTTDYSFTSDKETAEDRFSLFISKIPTSIDPLDDNGVFIYASEGSVFVKGIASGSTVNIYNTTGSLIKKFVSPDTEAILPIDAQGIYIVNVTGEKSATKKVVIR